MKIKITFALIIIALGVGAFWLFKVTGDSAPIPPPIEKFPISITMKISSPAFNFNEAIPSKYTCDGESISPPLQVSELPENTKSLALVVDDPDALSGTWIHWLVWNIDPQTTEIKENSVPQGAVQGTTSSGKTAYGPPCPPSGTHRYNFRIYALDSTLDLTPSANISDFYDAIKPHILNSAELMGVYSRE
ncbi:MAG: YbhB/YbcL family Raf kinase inhibitor-like protein [Candidatus Peregrinibacteria bacterium]